MFAVIRTHEKLLGQLWLGWIWPKTWPFFSSYILFNHCVDYIVKNRNFKVKRYVRRSGCCASQYKSCEAFLNYSYITRSSTWVLTSFLRFRHAKGPSDAESWVIKMWVDRQIAHVGCLIQSAEDFVNFCQNLPTPKCNGKKSGRYNFSIKTRNRKRLAYDQTASKICKMHTKNPFTANNKVEIIRIQNRSWFSHLCKTNQDCATI